MINNSPLVSIGIPVHNGARYIRQCIASLSKQTYHNIELIISDNASTDQTYALCKKIKDKNKRISLFRMKNNKGAIANFNFVLRKANGKYFMWAAHDDLFDKNYIKELILELEMHPKAILAISAVTNFDDHGRKLNFYLKFNRLSQSIDALKVYLLHPRYVGTLFYGIYRTSVIKRVKFYQDKRPYYNGQSDIITIFKVLLCGDLIYIPKLLFHKRDTGYYLSVLDHLSTLHVPDFLFKRIRTYILFPIGHTFDFITSIHLTTQSNLTTLQKSVIIYYCHLKLLRDFYVYIRDIYIGFVALGKGLIHKLVVIS